MLTECRALSSPTYLKSCISTSAGTTFLYDELVSRHPYIKGQVVMGAKKLKVNGAKEPHYWHQVFPDPLASYTRSYSFGG